jgi:CBS domain-containing protein
MPVIEEVIEFLKSVPPFQFLEDEDLYAIGPHLSMEFYPKGTVILTEGGPPGDALRIIKKGAVQISFKGEDGKEVVVDVRGEGETFGIWSILEGQQKTTVKAIEDTICYLLPKDRVKHLLDTNAIFTEFYLKSHISKYLDRALKERLGRGNIRTELEKTIFTTPVINIASRDVVAANENTSIREAARLMSQKKISSLIILDDEGLPVGIVTDRDLREKVVAKARDISGPVKNIMSYPLVGIDARQYCYEAIMQMIRHNIHHLIVVKDGQLYGIVTNHDIMLLQGSSPISIAQEIRNQRTIEGLASVARKINDLIGLLIKEEARAKNITRIISEVNDSLLRRVLELAEKRFGPPPVPYCFVVYGSEGRKEQTFKTDQDNGIVFRDPEGPAQKKETEEYFREFSEFVKHSLIRCGFVPCPGDYMASNPRWRGPLSTWKRYFTDWLITPTPQAILQSVILFDFRGVYGELSLAEQLKEHLLQNLKGKDIFLLQMAKLTVNVKPPLGFFRTFVVEKSGEHKNELNLKFRLIAPIINIARLYALEEAIPETSTIDRIEHLKEIHPVMKDMGDELSEAFEFVMTLRIHHQFEQIMAGREPDNYINPDSLTNLEKKTLKEACQIISRFQEVIEQHYMLGRVM